MKPDTSPEATLPACADCNLPRQRRACLEEGGTGAAGCPTLNAPELAAEVERAYQDSQLREFARQASIQEAACYANRHQRPYRLQPTKTRILEIAEFARRMGYRRLGLAFCIGLSREAALAARVLRAQGLEVASVVCKAGRASKERVLGLTDRDKVFQGTDESACNPLLQARLLEQAGVQLHVLLGLCVGHDSLFIREATVPVTVLAVKDRVTGHNPLAALYTSDTYYQRLMHPAGEE
jgi:uncharacterized metal-binding protein